MTNKSVSLVALGELTNGQEGDFFALLTAKEELRTRDGKPYFRVAFRDAQREVSFPIWQDSPWAEHCRKEWSPGAFYKLRAIFRDSQYGPQLEIRRIREVVEADAADGFDPLMLLPQSKVDPHQLFAELVDLVQQHIRDADVRGLVCHILHKHRAELLRWPAATRHHHAYAGGWLEHVLSVTQTCVYLAEKYAALYPDLQPPLNPDLVVAGGVLHDIGKLRELCWQPAGAAYTPSGSLIGHILQGRDILREAAAERSFSGELLLRLEHVIVSHQRTAEWGSPKPPLTPEALLVHYADDIDAKFHMTCRAFAEDPGDGFMTSKKNILQQALYRGPAV